jgi:hypothetical protein
MENTTTLPETKTQEALIVTMPSAAQLAPSPAQIQAWTALAENKNNLTAQLGVAELGLQQILLNVNKEDHNSITEALATYRKKHSEMVAQRKEFTSIIDANIVQPLMAFEKRADPKSNEVYIDIDTKGLFLRQAEAQKASQFQAIESEKLMFVAHCTNEYLRIENKYLLDLSAVVDTGYAANLKAKSPKPHLDNIIVNMKAVKIDQPAKFEPQYLTKEQMREIYLSITPPNCAQFLAEKIDFLPQVFINYESDLANSQAAIERMETDAKIAAIEAEKKVEAESAINTLVATASTPIVEIPKIKRNLVIEPINSAEWAQLIMTTFIANMPTLTRLVRVKSWEKLSIGQMADAIAKHATDTGETFKGVTYVEVQK